MPHRVLAELMGEGEVHTVAVRNGVVIHAPGQLDLGRTTRLANRAQRRALRALHSTCAIPGCSVRYDRCKLHHIIWWRHGGRTDLDNLLPVCTHHHSKIHDAGWDISLRSQPRAHHPIPRRRHPQHRPTQPTSRLTGGGDRTAPSSIRSRHRHRPTGSRISITENAENPCPSLPASTPPTTQPIPPVPRARSPSTNRLAPSSISSIGRPIRPCGRPPGSWVWSRLADVQPNDRPPDHIGQRSTLRRRLHPRSRSIARPR